MYSNFRRNVCGILGFVLKICQFDLFDQVFVESWLTSVFFFRHLLTALFLFFLLLFLTLLFFY